MSEKVIDTAKVVGANVGALSIGAADINDVLTTFSLLAAIGYTLWKWKRDYNKKQ